MPNKEVSSVETLHQGDFDCHPPGHVLPPLPGGSAISQVSQLCGSGYYQGLATTYYEAVYWSALEYCTGFCAIFPEVSNPSVLLCLLALDDVLLGEGAKGKPITRQI